MKFVFPFPFVLRPFSPLLLALCSVPSVHSSSPSTVSCFATASFLFFSATFFRECSRFLRARAAWREGDTNRPASCFGESGACMMLLPQRTMFFTWYGNMGVLLNCRRHTPADSVGGCRCVAICGTAVACVSPPHLLLA